MNLTERTEAFIKLGDRLNNWTEEEFKRIAVNAEAKNNWFTEPNVRYAIDQVIEMLKPESLNPWIKRYNISNDPKTIGIIMAGNIPLVGFHDLMCTLLTGHVASIKLSSEDTVLTKEIIRLLLDIAPEMESQIIFAERLTDADAYIATGSNNTSRYFDYYFSKKPSIIRKNRTSIGVLSGEETKEELEALGEDIFRYFGLGCRNISKVFVPEGYTFDRFFEAIFPWSHVFDNNKYGNNYVYNQSIYLLGQKKFLENNFFIVKEDNELHSPVSVLFYEPYTSRDDVLNKVSSLKEKVQCVASNHIPVPDAIPFGKLQQPKIDDYADGIDTMEFLTSLK